MRVAVVGAGIFEWCITTIIRTRPKKLYEKLPVLEILVRWLKRQAAK